MPKRVEPLAPSTVQNARAKTASYQMRPVPAGEPGRREAVALRLPPARLRQAQHPFLTGRASRGNGHGAWECSLHWLLKADSFAKVIEGHYENREAVR